MRDKIMFIKDKISDPTIRSLYERKSVRVFTGAHIPEDDVRIIAEAAAQAPTAGNQQLYTILRITEVFAVSRGAAGDPCGGVRADVEADVSQNAPA